ncbi:hypothetical protein PV327_008205 [Microctonus hyperodae]|uniref:Uncharacterized protein n=1 Tax=Microctonus hyperodae TaxID=165561 RepID=A0AA39F2N1_MICHY|nr:hypothetical protein PV327_008205 [Microctonus hyperodae]
MLNCSTLLLMYYIKSKLPSLMHRQKQSSNDVGWLDSERKGNEGIQSQTIYRIQIEEDRVLRSCVDHLVDVAAAAPVGRNK